DGRPRPDAAEEYAVDALVLGYGTIPETGLARILGCEHGFDEITANWYPRTEAGFPATIPDPELASFATTAPGVWVAGELAGAVGVEAAIATGTLAGVGAARSLDRSNPDADALAAEARDGLGGALEF